MSCCKVPDSLEKGRSVPEQFSSAGAMPSWCELSPASPEWNGCCRRQLHGPLGGAC